jgi:hypothetical protein
LSIIKGESRRGAAPGDVRQARKKEGRIEEAKDACGSLGFLDCSTRQFSWGCASADRRIALVVDVQGRKKLWRESNCGRHLWTRKEGACQAAQSRIRPMTGGNSLAVNIRELQACPRI